jgi:hypothetical protein
MPTEARRKQLAAVPAELEIRSDRSRHRVLRD